MGSITRGCAAKVIEANTNPVPLLFIPNPNIRAACCARSVFSKRAISQPEAKASRHKLMTKKSDTARKSQSGFAMVCGNETDAFE